MEQRLTYKLEDLAKELNYRPLYESSDFHEKLLDTPEVHRPGLQLDGFFTYFDPNNVQIIGGMELAFLEPYSSEVRLLKYNDLLSKGIPAIIVTKGRDPGPELLESARINDVTVLSAEEGTSMTMTNVLRVLGAGMAERITRHGVLMEVYGIGVLILGDSGIGKSETAIELIKRGHRLVADDAVEIRHSDLNKLVGSAPDLIRYYVEVRGIGIIDVRRTFGVGSVKPFQDIALVVHLEQWREGEVYDRLGLNEMYEEILGVKLHSYTVPVRPGRSLSVIIEVAAMEFRQKIMGFNAAREFTEQINRQIAQNSGK